MKNHLKRIASPRTWHIGRKKHVFVVRSSPGGHSIDNSLPLGVILRDLLKLSSTMGEAKKMLNGKEILVDGKRKKDHRLPVGLFDVISIPVIKKSFRVEFDRKGRLTVNEISGAESKIKLGKVVEKTALKKGKIQFNLHDGKNILAEKGFASAKVGDTLVLELPSLKVKETLELKKGSSVFLTRGKHHGDVGSLKEIRDNEAIYVRDGKDIETAKEYLFVIGTKKPLIEIKN